MLNEQDFLYIPEMLMGSAFRFIAAQQLCWWLKGGKGKLRGGRRWRSSWASPASPGTCPGQQLQLLLWGKSQLRLATAHLPRVSSPLPFSLTRRLSVNPLFFSVILFLVLQNCSPQKAISHFLNNLQLGGSSVCFCPLWVVFRVFIPTKWQVSEAEWGKYVSSPGFKISPPPR